MRLDEKLFMSIHSLITFVVLLKTNLHAFNKLVYIEASIYLNIYIRFNILFELACTSIIFNTYQINDVLMRSRSNR
jgi:hypothetical protein